MDTWKTWAEVKPHELAIIDETGRHLTWSELYSHRNRLVSALQHPRFQLQKEDRVILYAHNCLEYLIVNNALSAGGWLPIPMNWRLTEEEIVYICDNSESKVMFFEAEFLPMVTAIRSKVSTVKHWVIIGKPSAIPSGVIQYDSLVAEGEDVQPKTETMGGGMVYTGGTTGRPKGAIRRKARDPETVKELLEALDLLYPQVHLVAGPLYHAAPGVFAIIALMFGGTIVVLRKFNPETSLKLIEKHKITSTFMAPTLLKMIVSLPKGTIEKYNLSSLRNVIIGAAPCPMSLKEQINTVMGPVLYEFYGSSELGINTVLKPKDQLRKPGSCGQPLSSVEIKLLDDNGKEVPLGQEGVLYVKINSGVLDEYWKAPEKTTEMYSKRDKEWLTVGDIARKDEEGFIYICDRAIDMVISAGVNIYPAEIEDALHRHPAIQDCAVFGVPDEMWGERLHAAVVLKDGHQATPEEITKFCRSLIADYKIPREYSFHKREDFPRDAAGKIRKRLLRNPYWEKQKSRL